jgi:hypothetical protein
MLWSGIASLVVGVLGVIFFTYYRNDVVARVIIISVLWGALFLRGSWLTAKYARTCVGEPNYLLSGVLAVSALWFLVRSVLTPLMNGYIQDYMSSGILQNISMMLGIILYIMTMFGLIGLNTQRLERDLLNADQDIQDLEKLLPICANCNKIRDDQGYWEGVETYLHQHTGVKFTHSLCPECARKLYPELGKAKLK